MAGKTYKLDINGIIIGEYKDKPIKHTFHRSRKSNKRNASNKPSVNCPVCKVSVVHVEKHIRKVHPDHAKPIEIQESTALVQSNSSIESSSLEIKKLFKTCPYCNGRIRSDRLIKHLDNRCAAKKRVVKKNKKIAFNRSGYKSNQAGISLSNPTSKRSDFEQAAFRQSFDEPRDGGKHLGHLRRESDGKFGSLPLYDDYGDESDAD